MAAVLNAPKDVTDAVVVRLGEATTYLAAATSGVLWGFSISDLAVLVSTGVAVFGFLLHLWATLRRDRRQTEAHRLMMEKAKDGSAETK